MNSPTQNIESKFIQQQHTQEQNIKQLISWVNTQASKKNIPHISSIQQLSSGNIFLDIVSVYHPKKVDLTKIYVKPKDDYQILQNYKQLLSSFNKLGWKKFDPQKFRKRKEKDLINMTLFLKKILNEHLFDNNQSNIHTILNNIQSPKNSELLKTSKEPIKIQDRKKSKIISQSPHPKQRQSSYNGSKKEQSNLKKTEKKLPIPVGHPPKPVNGGIKATTSQNFRPKDIMTSPRLPPYPYHSSKNITSTSKVEKNQEQQLNTFQNMRITKLQKEKSSLLRKILQIQQIVAKQKNLAIKNNQQKKILDQISQKQQNKSTIEQQQTIKRIKKQILTLIGE